MFEAEAKGQFADELAELHDGSISLFVTLPVFRSLLVSGQRAELLARIGSIAVQLVGPQWNSPARRERSDAVA